MVQHHRAAILILAAFGLLQHWKKVWHLQLSYGDVREVRSHLTTTAVVHHNRAGTMQHHSSQRRFPQWKDGSIFLPSLLTFFDAMQSSNNFYMIQHNDTQFPETLYVFDSATVWTSHILRQNTTTQYSYRYLPAERLFALALRYLQHRDEDADEDPCSSWPSLRRALRANGTVPFLAWYADNV